LTAEAILSIGAGVAASSAMKRVGLEIEAAAITRSESLGAGAYAVLAECTVSASVATRTAMILVGWEGDAVSDAGSALSAARGYALSLIANKPIVASKATRATMLFVGIEIDASVCAFDPSRKAGALAIFADLDRSAGGSARSAVGGVNVGECACSSTGKCPFWTGFACAFARAFFAGFPDSAGLSAGSAVLRVTVCFDACSAAIRLGCGADACVVAAYLSAVAFAVVATGRACSCGRRTTHTQKKRTKNEKKRFETHAFILQIVKTVSSLDART
jgi:hypothetical protein